MGSKYHTIIVVPHERAKFRKLRVSNFQVFSVVGGVVAATLAAMLVSWLSFSRHVDERELLRLRDENAKLREVNSSFESSVTRLEKQLSDFEGRTRRLAIVAGLETLAGPTEAGIGGLDVAVPTAPGAALANLDGRLSSLAAGLKTVEVKLDERHRWIASTPAILPVKGILTSGFGVRSDPMTGRPAGHPAIDIAAAPGKPVVATADGIVIRAERDGGLGLAVAVSHGFGVATRYGHLSKLAVEAGAAVRRGDVIGYVGNSGRSTGYHLHYEVLVDGEQVNPLAYVLDNAG